MMPRIVEVHYDVPHDVPHDEQEALRNTMPSTDGFLKIQGPVQQVLVCLKRDSTSEGKFRIVLKRLGTITDDNWLDVGVMDFDTPVEANCMALRPDGKHYTSISRSHRISTLVESHLTGEVTLLFLGVDSVTANFLVFGGSSTRDGAYERVGSFKIFSVEEHVHSWTDLKTFSNREIVIH